MTSGVSRSARSHSFRPYRSFGAMVLKDTTSYRVAKHIVPSLSLLKRASLKIRKRTTLTQRIGKQYGGVVPSCMNGLQ